MSYLVIDIATGGKLSEEHSILSIAACKVTQSYEIMEKFHVRIRHKTFHVDMEALQANNFDLLDSSGMVYAREAKIAFFEFLGLGKQESEDLTLGKLAGKSLCYIPVGMNISFDIPFLKKFFTEEVYNHLFAWKPQDVLSTFEALYQQGVVKYPKSGNIIGIAEALGLAVKRERVHEPPYAIKLTAQIARKLFKINTTIGRMVAKHGHAYPELSSSSVAETHIKVLEKAREKLSSADSYEEDLSDQ